MNITTHRHTNHFSGFTLIEVLLVIAILAVLASIVIIAINPARQLAESRDAKRWNDVYAILNALHQYSLDNDGEFPETIDETERNICRTGAESCFDFADLSPLTDEERYLISVPIDPLCDFSNTVCEDNNAMYSVQLTEFGRLRVAANNAELEDDISVMR